MKRVLSIMVIAVLAIGLLAGCAKVPQEKLDAVKQEIKAVKELKSDKAYSDKDINVDPAYARLVVDAVDNKQAYSNTQPNGRTLYTFFVNGVAKSFSDEELAVYRNVVNSGNTVNVGKLTTLERVKASVGIGQYGHINFQANKSS